MLRLLRFLKGFKFATVVAPIFKLLEAAVDLIVPLIVASIIDNGIKTGDTKHIWLMCGMILLLGAGGLLASVTCQFLAAKASMGFGKNIRASLYRHVNTLDFASLNKFGASGLVTRLTNDVNQVQTGLAMFIRLILRSPFIVIGSTIMALIIDPKLSLFFLLMSLTVGGILFLITSITTPRYKKMQSRLDDLALLTRENLSGARVVRAFSRQEEENLDFEKSAKRYTKTAISTGFVAALLSPLTYAVVNVSIICVLWFGGLKVNVGALSQGQVLALVNYLTQMLLALVVLANLIIAFSRSSVSAKRINEVFATTPTITDVGNTFVEPINTPYKYQFNNVSFSYERSSGNALENISLKIKHGESLAIIGSTGSSKTTLINLLSRYYDVTSGEILLDGVNVKSYPFKQLRQKIALVPQKTVLFHGTLRENLKLGNENATDQELFSALKLAVAEEFVLSLKDGLDTIVSEGGKNFSGGQRQRLTIARALVKKPEILILDDSSSALDYATDATLRYNLKMQTSQMNVITISQRATSIRHADHILVLDEGKCMGLGTHDELIKTSSVYKEICSSQEQEEVE